MKTTIPPAAYQGLTVDQRLAAVLAARARGDDREETRLRTARPDHGPLLTARLDLLTALALAHECDRREMLIGFFAAFPRNDELAGDALQRLSDLEAAWRITLERAGIDADDLAKAGPPKSEFWPVVADMLPEADTAVVQRLAVAIEPWRV